MVFMASGNLRVSLRSEAQCVGVCCCEEASEVLANAVDRDWLLFSIGKQELGLLRIVVEQHCLEHVQ